MSEKRFTLRTHSVSINYPSGRIFDNKKQHSLYLDEVVFVLNEQQATINKLRKILAEAEDMIEVRLAEHYLKEYENIKHNIIGDNDD